MYLPLQGTSQRRREGQWPAEASSYTSFLEEATKLSWETFPVARLSNVNRHLTDMRTPPPHTHTARNGHYTAMLWANPLRWHILLVIPLLLWDMMDFFFQRHFGRRQKVQKHQTGPAVQASKARRRSSVGLPSVALVQSRRSSLGLPPVSTDGRRRASVGLLVASGQRRQSIKELGLTNTGEPGRGSDGVITREVEYTPHHPRGASGTISSVQRRLAVRYRRPSKVKSIEPHLLGSSMLLASVVQMGRELKDPDVSLCSCSESDGDDGSGAEEEKHPGGMKQSAQMHLTQAVIIDNIKPRPLLRPPRCLRRNSSHLLPKESVFQSSELGCGVYGRYNQQSSNQAQWPPTKTVPMSKTSPSLGQLANAGSSSSPGADTDVSSSGSSFSSSLGRPEGSIYYDPYLDTWDNFLSYVTRANTQTQIHM